VALFFFNDDLRFEICSLLAFKTMVDICPLWEKWEEYEKGVHTASQKHLSFKGATITLIISTQKLGALVVRSPFKDWVYVDSLQVREKEDIQKLATAFLQSRIQYWKEATSGKQDNWGEKPALDETEAVKAKLRELWL
jgi:hypothetical protein